MSKGRPLTAEFILSKGKAESLFATKSINLWGNNLDVHRKLAVGLESAL